MSKQTRTPTSPENLARVEAYAWDMEQYLVDLYYRWLDEKEHEDIEEYTQAVRKTLPEGFTFVRMNKRPFGFDFSIGTEAVYRLYANSTEMGWKRVK